MKLIRLNDGRLVALKCSELLICRNFEVIRSGNRAVFVPITIAIIYAIFVARLSVQNYAEYDNGITWIGLDWIEQCFTPPPTQYRL